MMMNQNFEKNKMATTLADLKPSQSGVIEDYTTQDDATERLREMGLVKGTRVEVLRLAPMGDPMELTVRGYRLSIRREEAARIRVKVDVR